MAYVNPVNRSAGELITAARWNQDVVANIQALKSPPTARKAELAGTFSTTSTSFVSVTNAEVEITTAGGKLMIGAVGTLEANTTLVAAISLLIDGSTRAGSPTLGLQRVHVPGSSANGFGFVYLSTDMAAANHTVTLQVSTSPGSALSVPQWFLWVQEA